MLPFLRKPQASAATVIEHRKPDAESPQEDQGLVSAAQDFISAMEAKDAQGVAAALRAAFIIMESEPHDEAPHSEIEE